MSQFRFQVLEMRQSTPQEWLCRWATRYELASIDDGEYRALIERHKTFTADDFIRIGKWKDGATTEGRWKPNVASVAYLIWLQAAKELPKYPEENRVKDFLDDWSTRAYADVFESGSRNKRFGLSRASTLLHFVSGGRYPIFDSRVRTAIARLLGQPEPADTVKSYMDSYLPLFRELAGCCETDDFRKLDKALFSYGAFEQVEFSN
jgi:hypothetical protein